jgi:hypothetical protein
MRPGACCGGVGTAVLVLALLAGCGDNGTGPDCTQGRKSVEECINALAAAYETEDIAEYTSCLSEEYVFEFAQEDWDSAGVTAENPTWSQARDLAATTNLFASSQVSDIDFWWEVAVPKRVSGDSARITIRPWIDLVLAPPGHEPFTLLIRYSLLDIRLARSPGRGRCWSISRIREYPRPQGVAHGARPAESASGVAAVGPATFGMLKWKFD